MVIYVKLLFTTILCWLKFRTKFNCIFVQSYVPCNLCRILLYGLCVRESVKIQVPIEDKVDFVKSFTRSLLVKWAMCRAHDWNIKSHDSWFSLVFSWARPSLEILVKHLVLLFWHICYTMFLPTLYIPILPTYMIGVLSEKKP